MMLKESAVKFLLKPTDEHIKLAYLTIYTYEKNLYICKMHVHTASVFYFFLHKRKTNTVSAKKL